MPNSSHRTEKGLPPALPVPTQVPPEAESDSLWDDNAFSIPLTPTEALEKPLDLAPLHTPGDNQPTVISRSPNQPGSEKHSLNSLRGRRLAHFELISPIGVGGMAAVIKGRDLDLDRIVALKVLPPEMAADPENIRRFHQEARAAAKLDHENIARVFYYGEDQNLHFIAFEFVQGDNLRTILERRGRLPVGEALHYILQVTTGLAHASSRDVVHRDIKPSNIIITPTGRAKLVDMGLARTQIPHDERQLTQSGVTLGTFDYISPEQAMEPRSADVRSDIYSLGCTFYHMLTGQPPVPEGTAARKLHFHEHELPVDPRQLNPTVPDEVAAILSRMMAKNPRDRYQRPEQLVEELLRVAQKENVGGERADGVLYVDAPVPAKPRRPLILVALAIAAVIALVFAVEQPGQPRNIPPHRTSSRQEAPKGTDIGSQQSNNTDRKTDPSRDVTPPPVAGTQPITWNGKEDKEAFLTTVRERSRGSQSEIDIVLNADLDLSGLGSEAGDVALTLTGKKITIRSGGAERKKILLKWESDKSLTTALLLKAEEVKIEGVRFDVTGVGSPFKNITAVKIVGGGSKHEIHNCLFYQHYPSYKPEIPMASLVLADEGQGKQSPSMKVTECIFVGVPAGDEKGRLPLRQGGQYAIARIGTGSILVRQCVFGPHQACFRLEGEGASTSADEDVRLQHCSVLLSDQSSVFHVAETGSARIKVQYSLFSRPQVRDDESGAAVLIRQASTNNSRDSSVLYTGEGNRYHGLDGFWLDGPRELAMASWKDFQVQNKDQDSRSAVLDRWPWTEKDPLAALRKDPLSDAFKVKLQMPELRLNEGRYEELIGVHRCGEIVVLSGKLPAIEQDNPLRIARKEKIVDPSGKETGTGIYRTLNGAIGETEPGDVILIKHSGKLALDQVTGKAGLDVTIKPADGFRPQLVLTTKKKEAALFQLQEGQIVFENLDFLLEPAQKEFTSQAILSLAGDGNCTFKGCTFTMSEPPQACQLAVVVMGDPESLMRRPVRPGDAVPAGPTLYFDRCLVRGKGDFLLCRASQPFTLTMKQTAVALTGSLLSVEGSKYASDLPMQGPTDAGAKCTLDLQHVTALVSGPLFELRPLLGELKTLVPVECNATSSLLAPLGSKSLVVFSNLDAKVSDGAIRERLTWKGNKNVYGNFSGFVDLQPKNRAEMMMLKLDREKWKELTSESESTFPDQIKFDESITGSILPTLRREQLAVKGLVDVGANRENLPAPPRDDSK